MNYKPSLTSCILKVDLKETGGEEHSASNIGIWGAFWDYEQEDFEDLTV
jgi:hypothetical protein